MAGTFYRNVDRDAINKLSEYLHITPPSSSSIDIATNELQNIFHRAAEITYPRKTNYSFTNHYLHNKPWFGPECNRARNNYHDARNQYSAQPSNEAKIRLKNASKAYKRTMNYYIKKQKQSNATKLRTLSDKNPKKYWKFLNGLKPKNTVTQSPSLQEFFEYFKIINTNNIHDHRFEDELTNSQTLNMSLNAPITETEIKSCISKLQNSKTPSPLDKIINEYIKTTSDLLLSFYCKLFNSVFETGHIPNTWLEGIIIPIYKNKGDPKDPSNYRPITILSCLGKLFTSILNSRLNKYLDDNEILDQNQAGFRKGFSCSDHIFTLYSLIELLKKSRMKLFCAYIDFSQAFDKVWRVGLWHKLLQNSIDGNFFNVITNMYKNIKSSVSHNGEISDMFVSEIGVRQGENLSPVLFSLFLNDLQSFLYSKGSVGIELVDPLDLTLWLKLLVLLYADDTIILSNSPQDFQNSLNTFNNYCNDWHLTVNPNKTKIMVFGARQLRNYNFKLGDHTIEITDQYHYLGVTFSSNGSFLKARKHCAQQASKAMHLLFTKVNNSDIPVDLILKLFDHTVLPILTYGSEIYGFENLDLLEKVHNDFLRKLTNARRSTPINFLYGELGRYPISIVVKSRMISFWNRLLIGDGNKLSEQIFKYMVNLPNSNFKWLSEIRNILNTVGRPDLWQNQFQLTQKIYINKLNKLSLISLSKIGTMNCSVQIKA
jgi:hypothetical protein